MAVTIQMQDNFDDNSIDTTKWDETDPNTRVAETGSLLQLTNGHGFNRAFFVDKLVSDISITSGVAVAQADLTWTDPGANEAQGGVFLYVDDNNWCGVTSRSTPGSKYTIATRFGGADDWDQTGYASLPGTIKITYDLSSKDIKFYYWNTNTWTQMGSTQNHDIGTTVKMALSSDDNTSYLRADLIQIDNAYFVKGDYTTNPPQNLEDVLIGNISYFM